MVGGGETRIEANGLRVVRDSLGMLVDRREHVAAPLINFGAVGIEFERLGETGQGAIVLPAARMGFPSAEIARGIRWCAVHHRASCGGTRPLSHTTSLRASCRFLLASARIPG